MKGMFVSVMLALLLTAGDAWADEADDLAFVALCMNGSAKDVSQALMNGANVNVKGHDALIPLMAAAASNPDAGVIDALIRAGADPNAKGEKGMTALMAAIAGNSNPDVITALVRGGADPNLQVVGAPPLVAALLTRVGEPKVAMALLEGGANPNLVVKGVPLLWIATAITAPSETVAALIQAGADVNAKADNGSTALAAAIVLTAMPPEMVRRTLLNENDLKSFVGGGLSAPVAPGTPLKNITLLLEAGADPNGTMEGLHANGKTLSPLAVAVIMPDADVKLVRALLKAGADPNFKVKGVPLLKLAETGKVKPDILKALRAAGAKGDK